MDEQRDEVDVGRRADVAVDDEWTVGYLRAQARWCPEPPGGWRAANDEDGGE